MRGVNGSGVRRLGENVRRRRQWLAVAVVCFGLMAGCRSAQKLPAGAAASKQYPVRGTVVQVTAGRVLLKHEAIPGFMEAMTMAYPVEDAATLGELHPGDQISAKLLADQDAAGPTNLRLKDVVIVGEAQPDYKPAVQYHVPATGDAVPDFSLLNQSGKTIHLKQFRGKTLLMTFVYTRCPLADYCPKMSRNFAEVDKALQADPKLYAKTHLLSVSFDPKYDTPEVLKSYGAAYTGKYVNETFAHWDFAAPTEAELPRMEQFFDLGVTGQGTGLQHSLSTLVIGPDGKVAAFWGNNEWTAGQALAAVKKAAA
jgi:protein SCO1